MRLPALVFGAAAVLACGGAAPDRGERAGPASGAGSAEGGSAGPEGGSTASGDTVSVYLTEYAIGIPETLPSRGTVLRVLNEGAEIHNLRFRTAAGEFVWSLDQEMSPGDTGVYEVELAPGEYTVICDFAGHDSRGMRTTVTVEAVPDG